MDKLLNKILIIIIAAYIFFNLIFFMFIRMEWTNNDIYMQYYIERIIGLLLESFRENNINSTLSEFKEIKAFSIYEQNGESIINFGNAPINKRYRPEDFGVFFNKKEMTIKIIRPLGMMGRNRMRPMPDHIPRNVIFVEIKISKYYFNKISLIILSLLFPIILLALLSLLFFLIKRNDRYKKIILEKENLAKLGEVSRTLAHEIKNPLGALRIQSSYIKKLLPSESKSEINVLDEEIDRLNLLVEKINDFLRDPVGTPEKIDIIDFVTMITKKYKDMISLNTNIQVTKLFIIFDRIRLLSIFDNLINNSIESNLEAGSSEKININLEKENEYIIIKIIDTGTGIKDFSNLYKPFITTKSKGTGIGLYITKRFIDSMKGEIDIKNNSDNGVTVNLKFKLETEIK